MEMNNTEKEQLENKFIAEMIRCAEKNPHLRKLVTSAQVSIRERDYTYFVEVSIPLRAHVIINREVLRQSRVPLMDLMVQRSLVELSLNLHKLGMQVDPIRDPPHLELVTDTPTRMALPIAIHHSAQEGQLLMHPRDYSNIMGNAFHPTLGQLSFIPALINIRL